ncbi:MAG: crossover junction endodeoxyribonuclease RuvC [Pseudonocardia sp.]
MRVLGVDPGLTRCGLGVVDGDGGRQVRCVAVEVVRSPAGLEVARRLLVVADAVERVIATHRPEVVAVERVFSQSNVSTVMGTAQASGVVALVAARSGLRVVFHTPSEVKAAVTGSGRADKEQVTAMVTRLLGLVEKPRPADAADALALAICHCWRGPMIDRMAAAKATSDRLAKAHRARLAAAAGDGKAARRAAAVEAGGVGRSRPPERVRGARP